MTKGHDVTKRPAMAMTGIAKTRAHVLALAACKGQQVVAKTRINKMANRKGYRVFNGTTYIGFFRAKRKAEACVREHDQSTQQAPSRAILYKYVKSMKTKKRMVYFGVVRVVGTKKKMYFPRCDNQADAAAMVAEYLETEIKDIKLSKSERETPEQSADRVALVSGLFRGWVPADLDSAITFRRQASSLQASGPAAYVAGLLGKEDRWKKGLVQVWDAMPPAERLKLHGLGSRDKSMVQAGAQALHALLSMGFVLWAGWSIPRLRSMSWPANLKAEMIPPTQAEHSAVEEERQWWKLHVHRNIIHHLSLTPLVLQLGIVRKTGKRGSLLVGNDVGEFYSLVPFSAVAHTKPLQTMHSIGMLLNTLHLPRTNVAWAQAQEQANVAADRLNIKRSQYHWPWLVRTYLFAEMRHHGIMSLKVAQDWNTKELQEAIKPDQNEWLPLWMSNLAEDSLHKLLRRIRFTEPLEMLSIYACVMSDTTIMAYSSKQIQQRAGQIRQVRRMMMKQFGREASPAVVMQAAMADV